MFDYHHQVIVLSPFHDMIKYKSDCDEERCVVVGIVCGGSARTISCRVGVITRRTATTKQSSICKVLDSGMILESSCQRMKSHPHHFCSFIFMHLQVKAASGLRCESDMTQTRLALILSLSIQIQSIH